MCSFQELFCNEDGYVICCNQCNHYQVLFNGTVLSINEEEYNKFLHILTSYNTGEFQSSCKDIAMPTPRQGVYILLSSIQLMQFHKMMEAADVEKSALKMMQLFHT